MNIIHRGGVIGTGLLYYLTQLGMTDVVLLEKGELASGSSGDSAAIVRQHYSNEVSIRLVRRSLQIFQGFTDEFDGAKAFTNAGWLFLVPEDAS
ncbi:FAD-dependent oxidoreductase, partial [uncultured Sulfitobacter sp.]|uniref:FAD-dependent oxidoreductase n=1 Tax=uncultured Sulfitobacter sp. TaxID=191468 RepID=UPI002596DA29